MLLPQVFHEIEKKIIDLLQKQSGLTPEKIVEQTGLSPDQVRRGIEWLRLKNLTSIKESKIIGYSLGKNGMESLEKGLPEKRLLDLIKNGISKIQDIQQQLGPIFGPAMGLCKKLNYIESDAGELRVTNYPKEFSGEKVLKKIGKNQITKSELEASELDFLLSRPDFLIENNVKIQEISLSKEAQNIDFTKTDSNAIDVEAKVPEVFVARTHPLKDTIDEIREIFVTLGFTEIYGNTTQPSFWNFDALFTPQDHPAREMQDTFYLDGLNAKKIAQPTEIRNVSQSHKKNWKYYWEINEAT